jgi:hypothetical protein
LYADQRLSLQGLRTSFEKAGCSRNNANQDLAVGHMQATVHLSSLVGALLTGLCSTCIWAQDLKCLQDVPPVYQRPSATLQVSKTTDSLSEQSLLQASFSRGIPGIKTAMLASNSKTLSNQINRVQGEKAPQQ